jgi:hypothetical protein
MLKIILLIGLSIVSFAAQADSKADKDAACREYFGKQMQGYLEADTAKPNISLKEIEILNAVVADYRNCCKKGTAKCFDQKWVNSYQIPTGPKNSTAGSKGSPRKKITCEEVSEASVVCGGAVYLHEKKGVLSCEEQSRLNNAKPVDSQGMGLESGAAHQ